MKQVTPRNIVAAAVLGLAATASAPALASDYGCRVLLCLAAVGSAPSECSPTLDQLWKDLAKGKGFPSCSMATASSAKPMLQDILDNSPEMTPESRDAIQSVMAGLKDSYAKQGHSYYDPCPAGTTALDKGAYAIKGAKVPTVSKFTGYKGAYYEGIGTGDGLTKSMFGGSSDPLGVKVCVADKVGTVKVNTSGSSIGYSSSYVTAGVYQQVVLMNPATSPRIIDVFVSGELYRRVRW